MFKCCRKPEYADDDLPQDQPRLPENPATPSTQQDEAPQESITTPTANQEDESQSVSIHHNDFLSFG